MASGAITPAFDVAQLVLYMFWFFFAGLIYYLLRENHREGYPMDSDHGHITGWPGVDKPKSFKLANGHVVLAPSDVVSPQTLNARPIHRHAAAPLEPIGNPLLAGVGPGAWADRSDTIERDHHGRPTLSPLRCLPDFGVSEHDADPRGMEVFGCDGEVAGVVSDLWVDVSDTLFRYLEVTVPSTTGTRQVLLPMTFSRITRKRGVQVHAIYSHQFADVPALQAADTVTTLEEEKIVAYFGAGMLYADANRAEPLL